MMAARGLEHEIEFAAQRSTLEVVPRLRGTRLLSNYEKDGK
jgi:phosphosulfolactate phosphohydrolase-like enzyme